MNLYIATWPNGTVTVLCCPLAHVLWNLDREGDPADAQVAEITMPKGSDFQIMTRIEDGKIQWDIDADGPELKTKRLSWRTLVKATRPLDKRP